MSAQTVYSTDLAGIEVGETSISDVRGSAGRLSYRDHDIESLVDRSFFQVVCLVLFGRFPTVQQEQALQQFMALHSRLDRAEIALLAALPRQLHPMLMLQGMTPLLDLRTKLTIEGIDELVDPLYVDDAHKGLIIAAKLPSLIAAWRQLERGGEPVHANIDAGFHENFLTMYTGRAPSAEQVRVLDITQILQMEHSFNAGTFAGRVCASTLAPIQSSIAASIGTLFGALHGGADQAALEMAETIIADGGDAERYVNARLQGREKIMGMGHREYRVVDPRARILKPIAAKLCDSGRPKQIFDTLLQVEAVCQREFKKKDKAIWANVDFFKGAVFYQLGVEPRYYTALFAMSRVYGYIAHYLEFSETRRLIRPRARYIKPGPS